MPAPAMSDNNIQLPMLMQTAELRAASFNEEDHTIEVCWTTGATVRRRSWFEGPYDEELVVSANAVRLDRLNAGAPFLNSHQGWDLNGVIGAVVPKTARIEKGQGLARIQLSRREDVAGIVKDIRDGVIRNVSNGYLCHEIEKIERDGQVPLWRVTDWEPLELTACPINADPGAQVRSDESRRLPFFPCQVRAARANNNNSALARMRMRAREFGLPV